MVFCPGDSTQNNEADNSEKASDRVTDDTKVCPVCGETIKAAAIKCRFCNTDLAALETAKEAEVERELFVGRPKPITSAGEWAIVVLTLGIAFLVYWIRSLSMRYRITTQRVQIEHGLFSTTKDNVELFRIDHFDLPQGFEGTEDAHAADGDGGLVLEERLQGSELEHARIATELVKIDAHETIGSPAQAIDGRRGGEQIGRASCRERVFVGV